MHRFAALARLASYFHKPPAEAPVADRRAYIRFECPGVQAVCQFHPGYRGASWWSPRVEDLSAGGIGLVQERDVPVGTLLAVELANARRSFRGRFLARVVHASPQGDSRRVGIAFVRPLKPEELRAILP